MKFTLNTLGAPGWTLEEAARNARAYGYAGVDLRLIDGEVISLESVRGNRDRLRSLFPADALPLAVLATSVRLATADPAVRQTVVDETRQWIDLAADLGVPVIRVYGGMRPEGFDLDGSIAVVAEALASLAPYAERANVAVGVETHDDFSSAAAVGRAIRNIPSRAIGAIWDMYHTARMGETPAQALQHVGDRLLNVHLKDGRRNADGWELLLLGEGEIPVKEALRLLIGRGYDDYISVEWEKKWHPELAEPEVAFPQHIKLLQSYVRELG
jgi:sugar phosphate isomerase/epimerase